MSTPEKRCLVIGANRGIGFQLATRHLAKGYAVYGTYRPETRDDSSVAEMKEAGIKTLELDFTDEDSIKAAAKEYGDGPLDVLINCGGLYKLWDDKPFTEHSAEDLLEHFRVNTIGPFLASKTFLPALEKAEQGKIITMSSDFASIADNTGGNVCYRLSKAGVNQLTKNMAIDLGKLGSKVLTLAVHPGYVATKMTGYYGEDDMETCMSSLVETIERLGKDIPTGSYVRWSGDIMAY
ncbi:hypothetical protein B0H66DRAFT_547347 [Apodospora peruviana]|uniref:C-factor n=1 Tax=Apodospora peruviana TaxID=516989 RepID=A0AAE0IHC1_9PEZI|nr:hypothetical protein B0H66DRAFT_547347 [Apodospora peruviana]